MNLSLKLGNSRIMTQPIANSPREGPPNTIPDLEAAKGGNLGAFGRLVEPLEERLFRQAFILCQNESVAEELAQDTLVAAWNGIQRFDGKCRIFTWLYGILFRIHKKRLRSLSRKPLLFWGLFQWNQDHPESSPEHQAQTELNPASQTLETEKHHELTQLIDSLPAKHQEVIRLRFFADASLEEIANTTNTSVGTVKSRLHYALEKLRQKKQRETL